MTRRSLILTAIVVFSLGLRVWLTAAPVIPPRQPLANFPRQLGNWQVAAEGSVPVRLEGVLGADDYIMRAYSNGAGQTGDLFVAYYKSMGAGQGPHSPKNCLPGSGWEPIESGRVRLGTDAQGRPLWVNRYVVEKDGRQALVLYWFREHGRTIANEYLRLLYFTWDAFRSGRRDGALVRITIPIRGEDEGSVSLNAALDLARTSLPELSRLLPN
jgi:EpsI family protein